MPFSLVPLLIHNEAVPALARAALRNASNASAEHRVAELEEAARVLYRETELDCEDVRELVGVGACA